MIDSSVWNDVLGTAGGPTFGNALRAFADERGVTPEELARACNMSRELLEAVFRGDERIGTSTLARMIRVLRSKPIEFMQKTGFLSLETYAAGLDPLYFLPEGPIRYEARIYMREINPRHAVPEADMTHRNASIKAIADDPMLGPQAKIELELAYLLRLAVQGAPPKG